MARLARPRAFPLRFNWRDRYTNPEQIPPDGRSRDEPDSARIEQWTEQELELVPTGGLAPYSVNGALNAHTPRDYERELDLVLGDRPLDSRRA